MPAAEYAVLDCDSYSPIVILELYAEGGKVVEKKRFSNRDSLIGYLNSQECPDELAISIVPGALLALMGEG